MFHSSAKNARGGVLQICRNPSWLIGVGNCAYTHLKCKKCAVDCKGKDLQLFGDQEKSQFVFFLKEKTYKVTFKGKDCNNQCMREGDFQGKRLTTFLGP